MKITRENKITFIVYSGIAAILSFIAASNTVKYDSFLLTFLSALGILFFVFLAHVLAALPVLSLIVIKGFQKNTIDEEDWKTKFLSIFGLLLVFSSFTFFREAYEKFEEILVSIIF